MDRAPTKLLVVQIDLLAGTGTFCRNLASGLKQYCAGEFDTTLLLLRSGGLGAGDRELFDHVQVLGRPVHTDWRRFSEVIEHTIRLRAAISRINPDVIFCIGSYANLLVPLAADGRPAILSEHAVVSVRLHDSRFRFILRLLMKHRYRRSPIAAMSRQMAQDLQVNFGATRAIAIYPGIDNAATRARAAQPVSDLPWRRPFLAACGRLSSEKDYPTLLRAYANARQHGLERDLLILGDGPDRAALESLARSLGLAGAAHFMGHRPNPLPYVQAADYFVLSSRWEGFGYSLLEAMSLGRPCLATNCPSGPPEILDSGRYGILVPPGDSAAMAEAMLRLDHCPALRERLSEQAIDRAAQLSLARMTAQYRQLFLDQSRRRRTPQTGRE